MRYNSDGSQISRIFCEKSPRYTPISAQTPLLGYCWIRASRFPMTKYTANLPERLNLVIDGARKIGAGARFSINPHSLFDAIEPNGTAGIDARAIAVILST